MAGNLTIAEHEAFEKYCQMNHLNCSGWQVDRHDCVYRHTCMEKFHASSRMSRQEFQQIVPLTKGMIV